ncbi:class I SAM-dependent methyltransferase [Pelomicrobium methylotrophicum]|nr:class I SAM-dependent methyltransferase [Pelomicrobium methylotrophicum]
MRSAPVRLLSDSRLVQQVRANARVLDVGCGNRRLADHVVNLDVVARPDVDVIADACRSLPFEDGVFDLLVCTSVLEHVSLPQAAVKEFWRVLRPGGKIWLEVPFLYHYHVSSAGDTADYWRWTFEGCRRLLQSKFRIIDFGHNVGPGTALRLMAAEVLAMPFFNEKHQRAYYMARWMWSWVLYPLSWMDSICVRKAVAARATGGFWPLAERAA